MIYVLYHRDKDGQGAAYAAWRKFGDQATYISVQYGEPVPEMPDADEIYIVDFSYSKDILFGMADKVDKLVVLDHHKTFKEELDKFKGQIPPNMNVAYFPDLSGAILAWSWFHNDQDPPKLLEHIQDRDLWKFNLEGTAEVHEFLCSYSYRPELWSNFVENMKIEDIIAEGKAIVRARDRQVHNICRNAFNWTDPDGNKVKVVNSSVYQSEVGNHLLERYPEIDYACVFANLSENKVVFSLRSQGDFDVSEVAKKNGGGGHKNAAGYMEIIGE